MKKYFAMAMVMLMTFVAQSQSQTRIPLTTGVEFPYQENKLLNQRLKQYTKQENKKVIIDLFDSGCTICFRMLPKMQALKEKFDSQVKIVLLGHEDRHIKKIYERFEKDLNLSLDVLYDSVFFNKYDVSFVPRYLWLNKSGVITAITSPFDVNESNIQRFINDDSLQLQSVFSNSLYVSGKIPMKEVNGVNDSNLLFRSVLSYYDSLMRPTSPLTLSFPENSGMFQVLGATMATLYRYAYFGRASWLFEDSMYGEYAKLPVFASALGQQHSKVRYNYSFRAPGEPDQELLKRAMRSDLATFFGYEVMVTRLNRPCWKLIALPGANEKLRTKYSKPKIETTYGWLNLRCAKISDLLESIYIIRTDDDPLIDETGIDFPIDIKIEGMLLDPAVVRKELRKAGLALVRSEKEMWVIVLSKPQKNAIAVK